MSRDKGKRLEYEIRDAFRTVGWRADRVPSSGAAQGFKGDVKLERDGRTVLVECKARSVGFDLVYRYFVQVAQDGVARVALTSDSGQTVLCSISAVPPRHYGPQDETYTEEDSVEQRRARRKLLKMREWLGEAQILVIKQDRHKPLYITYM